jgi:uncharacterized RDD family membrane protein YckC
MLEVTTVNPYAPPAADSDLAEELQSGELLRATRGQRFWAALIDGLLTLPLVMIGWFVAVAAQVSWISDRVTYALIVQASLLPLNVYQWVLVARTGQTLGKRWTHLQIVKVDGQPVDFISGVVLRYWIFYFSFLAIAVVAPSLNWIPSAVWLVNILLIFGAAHRCLHDYLAGTQVVVVPGGTP